MKLLMHSVGITCVLAILVGHAIAEPTSPCPRLFRYDPAASKPGRWSGVLTVLNDYDLSGLWVRVVFNKPVLNVSSSFGEVEWREHNEFLIKDAHYELKADSPIEIRFSVVYNPNEEPPYLTSFRLNARTVCPEHGNYATADASCGTVVVPNPLNMDDHTTHENEFPWHSALYVNKDYDFSFQCGASLISRNALITSARCITMAIAQTGDDVNSLTAIIGKHNLKQWWNRGIQRKQIKSITVHPEYNYGTLQNDIAVVILVEPVDITTSVRPVCLWEGSGDAENSVDPEGTAVGWGYDQNGQTNQEVTKTKMTIVPQESCKTSFPDIFKGPAAKNMFCGEYRKDMKVCNSEYGNGMVFLRQSGKTGKPVWQLRGVVTANIHQVRCDPSHQTAFTDVAKYTDWIHATLK